MRSRRPPSRRARDRRYRVAFLQTTMLGNMHRYRMLRAEVERDGSVLARWVPVRLWVEDDWLRVLPTGLRVRCRQLLDAATIFVDPRVDAVVVHAPELFGLYGSFHALTRRRSLLVDNSDAPTRPNGRVGAWLLAHAMRRADLFLPWSSFVASTVALQDPDTAARMRVLHPGLPLERWPQRDPPARRAADTFRLLFVGGRAEPKGLDLLLDAIDFVSAGACKVDVVTQSSGLSGPLADRLADLPMVRLHLDLNPGSNELQQLFRTADAFVLPTRYDHSPWVVLEAMATGVPVVASNVGGIPDMIVDGRTGFLVPPDDVVALRAAVERLMTMSPEATDALVERARAHVVEHFDAHTNTTALLDGLKSAIDDRRAGGAGYITRSAP